MKPSFLGILLFILVYPASIKIDANISNPLRKTFQSLEILHAIEILQPNTQKHTKKALVDKLFHIRIRNKLDWRLYLAVLFQESSLKLDPRRNGKSCLKNYKKCKDYGLGQVSNHYWGETLNLDRKRALTDPNYSLSMSYKVYIHYFNKYSRIDKKWYSRYHSGTPSRRKDYEKRIFKHYGKIVIAQKQFRRLLRSVKKYQKGCHTCDNQKQPR